MKADRRAFLSVTENRLVEQLTLQEVNLVSFKSVCKSFFSLSLDYLGFIKRLILSDLTNNFPVAVLLNS